MIELRKVAFAWPGESTLLHDINLHIAEGEKVVLLGANGCGKSTLLKILNGLVEPSAGEVRWRGRVLDRAYLRKRTNAREFRRACVLLFQHPEAMLFNPTVREELTYGLRQLGLPDVEERMTRWSRQLRLDRLLDKAPFQLSGGQKQKVALASLLTLNPEVMLLDEPSASLDPATVGWLIDSLIHSRKTLVVATHNLSLAPELGERCVMLGEDGRILYDGSTRAALAQISLLERAGMAHLTPGGRPDSSTYGHPNSST